MPLSVPTSGGGLIVPAGVSIEELYDELVGLTLESIRYELAQRKLAEFIKQSWRWFDPANYLHNWHVDAIAEHLEAVSRRQILRLIVNIPPRMMKTSTVNVAWPAWTWVQDPQPDPAPGPGHNSGPPLDEHAPKIRPGTWLGPGVRFLSTSHDLALATSANVKCRRIIESPWFQRQWGDRVSFAPDQNTKTFYENEQGGARFAAAAAGTTGWGGDIIIIDDPIDLENANSPVILQNVIDWWDEVIQSRLNDPLNGAIVIIMQRCNERDLTGHILAHETGWDHLCLPCVFERDHKHPVRSSLGYRDTREDGELLWAARYGFAQLDKLNQYVRAGQQQQRPTPREGGMFKRHWFEGKIIRVAPPGTRWVRHWDLAATKKKRSARTAGVKMGRTRDGRFVVAHVAKVQEEGIAVRRLIKATAEIDGKSVRISLPQDPGQAGKVQAQDYVAMMAGYPITAEPETGDKETRAQPFADQCEAGNVYLLAGGEGEGQWIPSYIDELCDFPNGAFADQVDASSGAFGQLVLKGGSYDTSMDWVDG